MTNLGQRTVTGVIGVSLMLTMILWNQYSFAFLFLFISVMSLHEFYSLVVDDKVKPQKWMGIICGSILYLLFTVQIANPLRIFESGSHQLFVNSFSFVICTPLIFLIFAFELYRKSPHPFTNIAITILGLIYISFTMALLPHVTSLGIERGFHPGTMIGYMCILWIYDIGAYFGGRWFGKTKLFERISPKKTWEGVGGGTLCAFIVAHFAAMYFTNLSRLDWLIITVIIIITSTYGDLIESMFKRSIKIKDSGSAIPGHGGFLDRFDGLFFSSPFVFAYLFCVYG